ncbi:MAG: DNA translocase FtsK 4TM domain-containing protein [Proteobacteria bacterium]|nr:DNA translocase FtsK 4TM domain-containing protein [Pseudomonadota bacterium]MCL2306692.1 DNA translocase FtsK 4TM domain-containing protein [Pseudomonadota bacterium]
MFFKKNSDDPRRSRKAASRPVRFGQTSPRIARLIGEAWWFLLLAVVLYGALIFFTYHRSDPGWSFSGTGDAVRNKGGLVGAWLADLCFYLLGSAAWWMIVAGVIALVVMFWRLRAQDAPHEYSFGIALLGFALLIVSSAALEATHPWLALMRDLRSPGGVIGEIVGFQLQALLGVTGARFLLVALWAIGLSLFSGISWLAVFEKLGWALERSFNALRKAIEARQDRKIGRQVMAEREQVVEQVRGDEIREPVLVVPPVTVIPQSLRIEKEKQRQLFDDLPATSLPPLSLLDAVIHKTESVSDDTLEFTSRLIERKLADFGISAKVLAAYPGPVITRYEIEPAIGVKGSQIVNLVKDLARALSVVSIRVVETIPGKSCMALELPNPKRQIVRLIEVLSSKSYNEAASRLTLGLGKDIAGNPVVADLAKMPHVLVAGTTGSGKSVALNAMILSLLYKTEPRQVRLLLIDPKMLELSIYEGIPHLLAPVVTDMRLTPTALNWCVGEMERRYKLMSHLAVRNLAGYNAKVIEAKKNGMPLINPLSLTPDNPEPLEEMPQIVVVVDELADLMMVTGKKIEELIARIAQKARAAGIHLILATQRPSVDVITGLIKANIPTRIAFQVASKVDSRTILDQMGAEALLGQGDMLFLPPGSGYPQRVHGAFVSDEEVHHVVEYLKRQGPPNYIESVLLESNADAEDGGNGADGEADPLYDQAVALVLKTRRPSISWVQRNLTIGYNRAARLIEQMERAGLVSAMQSNGNREVLAPEEER